MKTLKKRHAGKLIAEHAAFRMAIISSRGQVTIPQDIRSLLHVKRGSVVGFEPVRNGVLLVPMKVQPQDPYTEEEWKKIEKLSKGEGIVYSTAEEAKKHIASLQRKDKGREP
ncbi:MAG: AbrB/MazE/SpoVT family DNA-binding domain-containing protein [Candidatus Omnitrophica bacterium]|nr:AbrB/MazE/SpoVT family DNA-binding domain-containing protein [Candidatus Omnitrophota bacterium]